VRGRVKDEKYKMVIRMVKIHSKQKAKPPKRCWNMPIRRFTIISPRKFSHL